MARQGNLRYSPVMETIVRTVGELDAGDRSALERLVGHSLSENQQLVIQVMNVDLVEEKPAVTGGTLPAWCRVYEGLSDEEVARVEEVVLTRAALSRAAD